MLHLSSFVLALQPAPIHHTVRTVARSPPVCMRKKPFKGGDLGEFLKAGEAEAKFGPGRYAAVQEDLWRTKMKNERQEVRRELSMEAYKLQKAQILQDHAFLSALGLAAFWSFVDPQAMLSYGVGALLGGLYLVLLQRNTDSIGAKTLEEMKGGPPPIVVPVIMVLMVAKYRTTAPWGGDQGLELLPILAGFITNYAANLAQAIYPDYELTLLEAKEARARGRS